MEPLDYQSLFFEALQRAFAATSPAVRLAYFDLAVFYRNHCSNGVQMIPSSEQLKKISDRLSGEMRRCA